MFCFFYLKRVELEVCVPKVNAWVHSPDVESGIAGGLGGVEAQAVQSNGGLTFHVRLEPHSLGGGVVRTHTVLVAVVALATQHEVVVHQVVDRA